MTSPQPRRRPGRLLVIAALTAVLAVLGVTPALAETENNNNRTTANPITVGVAGAQTSAIMPAGDVDYYRFQAKAGVPYTVEVLNVDPGMETRLIVENASGTSVGEDYYGNGTGNVYNRVRVAHGAAQTLYVKVSGQSQSMTGAYTVRVLPDYKNGHTWNASGEPNDVRELAQAIGVGRAAAKTATIHQRGAYRLKGGDEDYYRFEAKAGVTYTVEVLNVDKGMETVLTIENASGTELVRDYYGDGTGDVYSRVTLPVSVSQTLFVRVRGYFDDQTGAYTVRVLPDHKNGHTWATNGEPNDTDQLAQEIKVGRENAIKATIYTRGPYRLPSTGDVDVYRFSAKANVTYTVEVLNVGQSLDTRLVLRDASGTPLEADWSGSGTGDVLSRVEYRPSVSQTVFIDVRSNTNTQSGAYTVRVLPDAQNGLTRDANAEPNDTFALAQPIVVRSAQTGVIQARGPYNTNDDDEDVFRFSARANRDYSITATSDIPLTMTLYDASGAQIGSDDCYRSQGCTVEETVRPSVNQDYFVRIEPSTDGLHGAYRLCVADASGGCQTFVDVPPGTQFYDEMQWMASHRISTGWDTPRGKEYRPLTPVKRDAMAAFLYRLAGSPSFTLPTKPTFRDVPRNNQFYKEIEWLASTGISTGWDVNGGKEYRPLNDINRDAMAAFLYRLEGSPRYAPNRQSFRDVRSTTQFYKEIEWMASTGISTGWDTKSGKEYRPLNPVNRDAMAAFLFRFHGKFGTPNP